MMDDLLEYAKSFLGVRYVYGGDDYGGVDCSGYISELLRSCGMIRNKERFNAQQFYDMFQNNGSINVFAPGSLAFYGKSVTEITHIAFMISNHSIIEAGGGTSETTTLDQAIQQNAFVRIRPVKYRQDFLCTIRPRYLFMI